MKSKYIVSRAKIKEFTGLKVSERALVIFDKEIKRMLKIMTARVIANGRRTIMPNDV